MIWLVGAEGMLGRCVSAELRASGVAFHATDREVDITDPAAIAAGAPAVAPTWLINCSAYTAVDQAESEAAAAFRLNRDAVGNLARYCRVAGAGMLHISTDYVFDGTVPGGYAEDAPVHPISVYGHSKAEGEALLRQELPEHIIVRTAWLYAEHGRNFVLTMLRLLAERDELTVVADQHGSPTYAADLARAIVAIVNDTGTVFGTFHFTNAGVTTWCGFADTIQTAAIERGLLPDPRTIRPVTTDEYPTAAKRPQFSALACDRIAKTFRIRPRPWQDALAECLDRYAQKHSEEAR